MGNMTTKLLIMAVFATYLSGCSDKVQDYPCPSGGATTAGASTFESAACTSKDNCNEAYAAGKNKYSRWVYHVDSGEYDKSKEDVSASECASQTTKCANHTATSCPVEPPEIAGTSMSALTDGGFQAINNADELISEGNVASSTQVESPYANLASSNAEDGGVKPNIGGIAPKGESAASGTGLALPDFASTGGAGSSGSRSSGSLGSSTSPKIEEKNAVDAVGKAKTFLSGMLPKFEGAGTGGPQGSPFKYTPSDGASVGGAGDVSIANYGRDLASAENVAEGSFEDYLNSAGPLSLFERVHTHYGKVARDVHLESVRRSIREVSGK